MKIVIVDDEQPARARLARVLGQMDDWTVVGEAARRAAGATSSLEVVAGASAGWGATAFVYSTPNVRQGGIRTGKCEEDTYTCSIPK